MNLVESGAGAHACDPAGEVKKVGGNSYLRDERGRVTSRTIARKWLSAENLGM